MTTATSGIVGTSTAGETGLSSSATLPSGYATAYQTYNGFDLIWSQNQLQAQMSNIEAQMQTIETNDNLSDTEKMFTMQMTMNSWSAISNLRTNMLKSVSDTLKSVARNIN